MAQATAAGQEQKEEKKAIVLIGIDSSEQAHNAFEWYVDNIYKPDHQLLLVHIADPPFVSTQQVLYMSGDLWSTMLEQEKMKVKQLEEEYATKMRQKKVCGRIKAVFHAKPGEALVQTAKEEHATFIVLGSHGHNALSRAILGSTSTHVMHHAHCSVTVCPLDPRRPSMDKFKRELLDKKRKKVLMSF